MPQIIVNGKTYASMDELPPDVRQAYEKAMGMLNDGNQNGVPDLLEGALGVGNPVIKTNANLMQFVVDGKVYPGVADLPPEAREKYEQALIKMRPLMVDTDGNGIPDIFEGKKPATDDLITPEAQPIMDMPAGISQNPPDAVISDVTPKYGVIAGIFLVALIVVGLIGFGVYIVLPLLK
jgi:hypothetical protein